MIELFGRRWAFSSFPPNIILLTIFQCSTTSTRSAIIDLHLGLGCSASTSVPGSVYTVFCTILKRVQVARWLSFEFPYAFYFGFYSFIVLYS